MKNIIYSINAVVSIRIDNKIGNQIFLNLEDYLFDYTRIEINHGIIIHIRNAVALNVNTFNLKSIRKAARLKAL